MKVVQILPELNAGGVERGTLELSSFLVKQGHESIVVSNGGAMVEKLEKHGARHVTMPVHRKSPASLLQVLPLLRLLRREKPDILHIRSRVPGWVAWLAWRGMNPATRPHLVSTVHGFYSVNAYSAIMTRGERVIAVSESIRTYILENYPKTPPEKIQVIHRGISPQIYHHDFQPSEKWLADWRLRYPGLEGKHVMLLPGRITRLKGHADFFRIVASLNECGIPVHGLVVGDTHYKKRGYYEELRAQVMTLGVQDHITFLGHCPDIREIMSVSDIVCALSQQPESFGRTVLEALALGKPVVGYDCGGVGELLAALFPAGRVPLGDVDRAIDVAAGILKSFPEIPPIMDFTLDRMLTSTLDVYQSLVSRTPLQSA